MKNNLLQPKILIPAFYSAALLVIIFYAWNEQAVVRRDGETSLYRNLMEGPAWIKRGFDTAETGVPDTSSGWYRFKSPPLRVMDSPLPDLPKRTWLSPWGKNAEEFTIIIPVELDETALAYLHGETAPSPGIFISYIGENWEIFFNGKLVRSEMHLDEQGRITSRRSWRDVMIPLDKSLLFAGTNTLTLRIVGDPAYDCTGLYYTAPYYLDDFRLIQERHQRHLLVALCGIFAFCTVYHLVLFLTNFGKKEICNLYYSLFSILICCHSVFRNGILINPVIPNSDITLRLEYTALFMMIPLLGFFVECLNWRKLTIVSKAYFCFCFFLSLTQALFCAQYGDEVLQIWSASALLYFTYIVFYDITYFYFRTRHDNRIAGKTGAIFDTPMLNILAGCIVNYVCGIYDVLDILFFHMSFYLFQYGTIAFNIGTAFTLLGRIGEMYKQVEQSNTNLETMVSRRTRELEEQTMIALQSSRAKSEFLATMSHEIRTPLNAVIGLSEIELRGVLPEKSRNNIEQIYQSGSSLLGIVNDLLDISKIEAGAFKLIPVEYESASFINDTVNLNRVRIGLKPVIFALEISGDFPHRLRGDELRVKQVLNNILSNAIKYTRQGRVTLALGWERRSSDALIRCTVRDTGIGIRDDDLEKLFTSYTQVDAAVNRKIEGTGLGLAITKKLVEMMGGSVLVESEYGTGSSFTVEIIQGLVDDQPIGEETAEALRGFRYAGGIREHDIDRSWMPYGKVLVVDDMLVNLQVVQGLLEPYGLRVDFVTSGQEALERIQSESPPYDLVFMDHMMPGMDGIEATAAIRDWEQEQKRSAAIPVIALTANALTGNMEMFLSKGFDGFISKPVDIFQLDAALNKWVRDKQGAQTLTRAKAERQELADSKRGTVTGRNAPPLLVIPGVDTARGLIFTGGTEDGYRRVISMFCMDAEKRLALMHSPPEKEDLLLFTTNVHALKSAAASIGAAKVSAEAERLEAAGKTADTAFITDALPAFVEGLETLVKNIRAALEITAGGPGGSGGLDAASEDGKTGTRGAAPSFDSVLLGELREALKTQNVESTDRILEVLSSAADSETRVLLEQISDAALMAEFERAADLVESLLLEKI